MYRLAIGFAGLRHPRITEGQAHFLIQSVVLFCFCYSYTISILTIVQQSDFRKMWHDFGHPYLLSRTQPTPFCTLTVPQRFEHSPFHANQFLGRHYSFVTLVIDGSSFTKCLLRPLLYFHTQVRELPQLSPASSSPFGIGFPTDNVSLHFSTDCNLSVTTPRPVCHYKRDFIPLLDYPLFKSEDSTRVLKANLL